MDAMHARAKRSLVQPQGQANADINVTPLVDVVLVLLIIFMVLTPLLQRDLEVRLPEPSDTPADPSPTPSPVVVGLSAEGQLTLDATPVSDADYLPRLRGLLEKRPTDMKLVYFMPDERVNYGKLVAALDGAKEAGARMLGVATEAPPTPSAK